jgi:hypothetical protein
MIPQQIGIAATFNTETAKEDQKFQLINKTIKLPNQLALFNSTYLRQI